MLFVVVVSVVVFGVVLWYLGYVIECDGWLLCVIIFSLMFLVVMVWMFVMV